MKKFVALLLIVVTLLTLSACGSKDAEHGPPNLAQTVRSHGHSTEAANAPWKMLI